MEVDDVSGGFDEDMDADYDCTGYQTKSKLGRSFHVKHIVVFQSISFCFFHQSAGETYGWDSEELWYDEGPLVSRDLNYLSILFQLHACKRR